MAEFTGSFNYWPVSLRENYNSLISNEIYKSTNNFLVPTILIFLPADTIDTKYVFNDKKIYFLKEGYSKTIYSQHFPDAAQTKIKESKNEIEKAKLTLSKNKFESKEFSDYTIIKLASTKKHLFAFAKANNKYYILKIQFTSDKRFDKDFYVSELVFNEEIKNDTEIELDIYDLKDSKSFVFIKFSNIKNIYYGKFHSEKKGKVRLNKIIIKTMPNFSVDTFCLRNDKQDIKLAAFDNSQNLLIEFVLIEKRRGSNKKLEVNKLSIEKKIKLSKDEKVTRLCSYSIHTRFISEKPPKNQENIDLVLIQTRKKIMVFDTFNQKHNILIGEGDKNIDYTPNYDSNLNDYKLEDSTYLYAINDNGIIFNDPFSERLSILMNFKLRQIFFSNDKEQPPSKPDYYDFDNS